MCFSYARSNVVAAFLLKIVFLADAIAICQSCRRFANHWLAACCVREEEK